MIWLPYLSNFQLAPDCGSNMGGSFCCLFILSGVYICLSLYVYSCMSVEILFLGAFKIQVNLFFLFYLLENSSSR